MVVCQEISGDNPEGVYDVPASEVFYVPVDTSDDRGACDWDKVSVVDSRRIWIWACAVAGARVHADNDKRDDVYYWAGGGSDIGEQEDTDGYAVSGEKDGV